jgi:hypothetical protein
MVERKSTVVPISAHTVISDVIQYIRGGPATVRTKDAAVEPPGRRIFLGLRAEEFGVRVPPWPKEPWSWRPPLWVKSLELASPP